jgi:tetratricopeptide (TPR) repeat protein/energy-coupling factor transporter ATP-binding protein EcfA2
MAQREFISRFSPNRTDPAVLEQIFVQRRDLLDQSVAVLRESALTDNKHHLLFVGPRGCGKTHLLALIVHRLEHQTDLADHLRIAWLNEDETSISFLDLLVRIYRALSDRYPLEFPLEDLRKLYGTERQQAQDSLSQNLINRIGNRTVLVLVENLDALFNQLDVSDQRTWRAFVQNHPVFATAATAQSLFAGVSDREQPFFGFFDTRHLRPLTVEEATELLQRIARLHSDSSLTEFLSSPRGRARVHAIHHLSGGNHRLYIVLSDFLTQETLDALVRPLEEMVDERLTPYYQERLRWLSPLQRKIVEFLCFRPNPVAVKVIADRLFAEHGTITSQLKKLREMGYVTSNPSGRESLYELAEPLMRLTMQVKDTRDHQPLELIVDFLRVWYEREELEQCLAKMDATASARPYFTTALGKLQSGEPNLRHQLLRDGLADAGLQNCRESELETMRALAEESSQPFDWLQYALACQFRSRFNEAIEALTKVIEQPGIPVEPAAMALYIRSVSFRKMDQMSRAVDDCTRLIELPGAAVDYVTMALNDRGEILVQTGRIQDGIADFTRVVERQGAPADRVAWALYGRGAAFQQIGLTREAISDYTRFIESPDAPAYEFACALLDRGYLFWQTGSVQQAISDFTRLVELSNAPPNQVANGFLNRGVALAHTGHIPESLADFTRVIEMPNAPADAIVGAYYNRGLVLGQAGRMEEAVTEYTRAMEWPRAPINHVAAALNNRGTDFAQMGHVQEAISDWTRVIEMAGTPVELLAMALNNRALQLSKTGDPSRAIADYECVINLPQAPAIQVAKAKLKLAESFFCLDQWDAGIKYFGACLKEKTVFSIEQVGDAAVGAVFRHIGSPLIWQARLATLAGVCAEHGCIANLGDAFVRHLAKLANSPLSSAGLDQWLNGWESETSRHPAMQLPLRLVRTGIAYLKTQPREETVLLQLPKEERTLVRQALGLPNEQPE